MVAGSVVSGLLYEVDLRVLMTYTILMQIAALGVFAWLRGAARKRTAAG